jgi:hypothetical protein
MIAELAAMRQQQEASARASAASQRQAMIDAQNNAAQQGMTQSSAMASQNLMRQQEYQRAMDAAAKQAATEQASVAGQGMTGGAFDVNAMNEARMANLGAPIAYPPKIGAAGAKIKPQETDKTKMANAFGMPSVQGLTFGGA